MTDIEIVREAVEFFTVNHLKTIEMAVTVKCIKKGRANYISVDLNGVTLEANLDKLHHSLVSFSHRMGSGEPSI
jgi:hypothetical protein